MALQPPMHFVLPVPRSTSGTVDATQAFIDQGTWLNVALVVTTFTGSNNTRLNVHPEWSLDGTHWFAVPSDAFDQKSDASNELKTIPVRGPRLRFIYEITGTNPPPPSITFGVTGYITP